MSVNLYFFWGAEGGGGGGGGGYGIPCIYVEGFFFLRNVGQV